MRLIFKTEEQSIIDSVHSFLEEWNNASTTISTKTSGSTGSPKEITVLKEHMIASAKMTGAYLNLNAQQNALLSLPLNTIGGKMMLVRAIVLDLNLIVVEPSRNPLKNIEEKIHFSAMTPMQVNGSFNSSLNKMKEIDTLIIGGAALPKDLENKISSLPLSIYQTFGMTETISHVAMRNLSKKELMYEALPNIKFSTVDAQLIIHAPHIGIESITTNDVVKLMGDRKFIWFGRNDFTINSGGIKIHPESIERLLSKIIDCPFFSTSIPDNELGEKHILILEKKAISSYSKKDFESTLKRYEIPKEIFFLEEFSFTHNGKIDRIATKKRIQDAKKQIL